MRVTHISHQLKRQLLQSRRLLILHKRALRSRRATLTTTSQTQVLQPLILGDGVRERESRIAGEKARQQFSVARVWPDAITEVVKVTDPCLEVEGHGAERAQAI